MEFGVLGALVVSRSGAPVDVDGPKRRALLGLLLINANRVVSTDTIIEELWGDDGKDHQSPLWVVVSRLRTGLEPDRPKRSDGTILITQPPGYMLTIDPDDLVAELEDVVTRHPVPGAAGRPAHDRAAPCGPPE